MSFIPDTAKPAGLIATGPTQGVGYGLNADSVGPGGAVTQITDRSTAVTLNKLCGAITTATNSLAAEVAAEFTVNNTTVAATDVVILSQKSGSNGGNTDILVSAVATNSFNIKVANNNAAGGGAETGAIIINFAVVKATAS